MQTPDQILDVVGRDRIKNRAGSLMRGFRRIRHKFPGARIDATLCTHLTENYYTDLLRLKIFHATTLANQHRKAAFMMKWIVKVRPIQIEEGSVVGLNLILANEFFAVMTGLELLGDIKPDDISQELQKRLVYNLHYRSVDAETLTTTMVLLEKALKNEQP